MKRKSFLALVIVCIIAVFTAVFSACNVIEGDNKGNDVAATRVSLSQVELSLNAGETAVLYAAVVPSDATDKTLIWSSDSESVATVNNGTVTAIAEGTAVITVKTTNNKTATCTVTVTASENPPAHKHWYSVDWTFDANSHWHAANCEHKDEKSDFGEHVLDKSTYKCADCGYDMAVYATSVNMSVNTKEVKKGESFTLTATIIPSNTTDKTLIWSSDNEKVATVNNGKVTAIAEGTAVITVKTTNNKTATCTVTVKSATTPPAPDTRPVTGFTLSETTKSLKMGETETFTLTVSNILPADTTDDKTVTWKSSDESVATVANGVVTAKKAGNVTITAKVGTVEKTCAVTIAAATENPPVSKPVTGFTLSETTKSLKMGETETFTLTVSNILPADTTDDKTVTWKSSDESVAAVANGVVTAKKAGTVTITAKVGKIEKTCAVTIAAATENPPETKPVTDFTLSETTKSLKMGETETFTLTVSDITPADTTEDKNVTWKTSDETVATVVNGVVTALKAGNVTITAKVGTIEKQCAVTIAGATENPPVTKPVTGFTLSETTKALKMGESETFTLTVSNILPADTTDDKTVTWKSSDESVATVVNGVVTALKAGNVTITAKVGTIEKQCAVTIAGATENPPVTKPVTGFTLSETTKALKMGETETFTLTVSDITPADTTEDKTVTWSSSDDTTATVVGGVVTALKAGNVTITAKVGTIEKTCAVTIAAATVTPPTPQKYTVTFINDGETEDTQTVEEGDKAIAPKGVTKEGYTLKGWSTSATKEELYNFDTTVNSNLTLYAVWEQNTVTPDPSEKTPITYSYAGAECAAFEWTETSIANVKVEYKKSTESAFVTVDKQLIRQKNNTTARVDIVGLAGGVKYDFKITASDGKSYTKTNVEISAHDRSGYAHFGKTDGVGAYKDDGTPKANAQIIYLTETNKNNVDGKGNSIAEFLASCKSNSNPIIIRVIGTVGSATWNKKVYSGYSKSNPLSAADFVQLTPGNGSITLTSSSEKTYTQQQLIDGGFNTLNTKPAAYKGATCEPINGLNSKIMCQSDSKLGWVYDSIWNDCPIEKVKNVTIEGIGEDAEIFQWGFTFKNSSSIEVRNLHFDDYTEDACSFEGSESKASSLSEFKSGNVWLHHNTFDEGMNYWDVCDEQDKGDGDGSTDFKGIKNITIAYNHYINTHKTNLIGGGDGHATANVTFHHNYYESCNQRMPLGRQANMHMYNNYYSGSTLYSISLRAGAYAFIENCYFTEDASNHYPVELVKGSYGAPSAKIVNCEISKSKVESHNGVGDGYLYIGNDRNATVDTSGQRFAKNFDTDSDLFYYKDGKSDVKEMLTAEQVKTEIPKVAGVQKRGSGVVSGGTTSGGDSGNTGGDNENTGGDNGNTGEEQTQSGQVIIFSNGAKTLVGGELSSTLNGVTVTASAETSFKSNKFAYNGVEYNNSYKLDSKGELTVKLTETKEVTFCYYVYHDKANPQISIGGATYGGGDGTTDAYGRYFTVKVTLQANTDYKIIRLNGIEIDLCYMLIG